MAGALYNRTVQRDKEHQLTNGREYMMTLAKDVLGEDGCENAAKVASKYGYQIVCDDDEEKEEAAKETDPNCEKAANVASKYGYMINCDEMD